MQNPRSRITFDRSHYRGKVNKKSEDLKNLRIIHQNYAIFRVRVEVAGCFHVSDLTPDFKENRCITVTDSRGLSPHSMFGIAPTKQSITILI